MKKHLLQRLLVVACFSVFIDNTWASSNSSAWGTRPQTTPKPAPQQRSNHEHMSVKRGLAFLQNNSDIQPKSSEQQPTLPEISTNDTPHSILEDLCKIACYDGWDESPELKTSIGHVLFDWIQSHLSSADFQKETTISAVRELVREFLGRFKDDDYFCHECKILNADFVHFSQGRYGTLYDQACALITSEFLALESD